MRETGRLRWLFTVSATAALYFGAAQLGFALAFVHGTVSSVWAPTGLALALVLLGGRRMWPAILLGEFLANVVHGTSPGVSFAFGCGDVLEAFAGQWLLARVGFRPSLARVRDVFALLGLAALLSTMVGATVGTLGLILGAGVPWAGFWSVWHVWWLGDASGDLIVAPLVLAFATRRVSAPRGWAGIEVGAFGVALVAIAIIVHELPPALAFLSLPVLIWGALRFGQQGATLANAVFAGAGVSVAAHATTELAGVSLVNRLLFTQNFIAIAAMTTLVLAAIITERTRAVAGLRSSEAAAKALADEQAALGRVATAVARESPVDELFPLAAEEAGRLLGAAEALIVRAADASRSIVIGGWAVDGAPAPGSVVEPSGTRAPIAVYGVEWGELWVSVTEEVSGGLLSEGALGRFCELLGMGIANAEGRQSLLNRASTDPLTGLANHRTFHERLVAELARCQRYGRPIAVAMIDIDRFKAINDTVGHLAGDGVLANVAHRIAGVMRSDTIVARLGGDELAVVLPECDAETACRAVERARAAVSSRPIHPVGMVTLSAGVCDNTHADSSDRLMELADGALYWAKAHGRNACVSYSPEVVQELSDAERADRLAHSQAVIGLRALARAIDAKDPATTRHSERVAELAAALARARSWPEPRVELLREAALVHDVGKLAVPDTILSQPFGLTDEQYELVKGHAALGAEIATDILDAEQVQWIRWHHERADGRGYPDGMTADELPEGAKLLALADAWEAMTTARAYSVPKSTDEALAECVSLGGRQFAPEAIEALLSAHEAQALEAIAPAL